VETFLKEKNHPAQLLTKGVTFHRNTLYRGSIHLYSQHSIDMDHYDLMMIVGLWLQLIWIVNQLQRVNVTFTGSMSQQNPHCLYEVVGLFYSTILTCIVAQGLHAKDVL
jgi:hypothetical protein